jgi:hypothetical protein
MRDYITIYIGGESFELPVEIGIKRVDTSIETMYKYRITANGLQIGWVVRDSWNDDHYRNGKPEWTAYVNKVVRPILPAIEGRKCGIGRTRKEAIWEMIFEARYVLEKHHRYPGTVPATALRAAGYDLD